MRARQQALRRPRLLDPPHRGRRQGPQSPVPAAAADGAALPLRHLQLALPHRAGASPGGPLTLLAARQGARRLVDHQRHDLRARQSPRLRPLGAVRPRRLVLRRGAAGLLPFRRACRARRRLSRDRGRAHRLPRAQRQSALRRLRRGGPPGRPSRQRRLQRCRAAGFWALRLHHQAGQALLHRHRLPAPGPAPAQSDDRHREPGAPRGRGGRPRDRCRGHPW